MSSIHFIIPIDTTGYLHIYKKEKSSKLVFKLFKFRPFLEILLHHAFEKII